MSKSFKKSNPLDKINNVPQSEATNTPEMESEYSKPSVQSEPNVDVEPEAEAKKKYLRLNITKYHDYISIMADHNKMSMTKYINNLISTDKIKNEETYNKLKQLEEEINRLKRGI